MHPLSVVTINRALVETVVTFFVPGKPATAGSKKGFVNKKTGRVIITEDCRRSKTWREAVRQTAVEVVGERPVLTGALMVDMTFYLPRPKSHYGTGRNQRKVKPSAPRYHTKKPDLTKIIRSTEDALTGIVADRGPRFWEALRRSPTARGEDRDQVSGTARRLRWNRRIVRCVVSFWRPSLMQRRAR